MLDPLVTCCVNAIAASSTLSLVLNRRKVGVDRTGETGSRCVRLLRMIEQCRGYERLSFDGTVSMEK